MDNMIESAPINLVGSAALPLFVLYLLVLTNYSAELVSCRLQHQFQSNMLMKHVVGLLIVTFLVVAVAGENADRKIIHIVAFSLGVYLWFLMTARCDMYIVIPVLVLLLVAYTVSLSKSRAEREGEAAKASRFRRIQNWLAGAALVLSVIGFVLYVIEKKREYGASFDIVKFFNGQVKCRNFTPENAKIFRTTKR